MFFWENEKQKELWDSEDEWHFNKNKNNCAWGEITKSVDVDVKDAEKKMSSLLGSFRRGKVKGRKTLGNGRGNGINRRFPLPHTKVSTIPHII